MGGETVYLAEGNAAGCGTAMEWARKMGGNIFGLTYFPLVYFNHVVRFLRSDWLETAITHPLPSFASLQLVEVNGIAFLKTLL